MHNRVKFRLALIYGRFRFSNACHVLVGVADRDVEIRITARAAVTSEFSRRIIKGEIPRGKSSATDG